MQCKLSTIYDKISVAPDGCWNWTKSCCTAGYGQLMVDGVRWMAHRYVAHVVYGISHDSELVVRHECRNPRCCNPHHLLLGTHKDNYNDSLYEYHEVAIKNSHWWVVDKCSYRTIKEAYRETGISQSTLIKYTDKVTRIFDIDAYRSACRIAGVIPRI